MHTHQFQVLLKNVPCWLHHFEHHVILDILYKIQHPLPQCESTSEPREKKSHPHNLELANAMESYH